MENGVWSRPNESILLKTQETHWITGSHDYLMASTQEEENVFIFTIEGVNNSPEWSGCITVQTYTSIYLSCVGPHCG